MWLELPLAESPGQRLPDFGVEGKAQGFLHFQVSVGFILSEGRRNVMGAGWNLVFMKDSMCLSASHQLPIISCHQDGIISGRTHTDLFALPCVSFL